MNASDVSFRVTPEALLAASVSISNRAMQVQAAFDQAQRTVDGTASFWQGDAAQAYRNAYGSHKQEVEEILARLREHVVDLNQIAGNYQLAEQWAVQQAETLPDQVIV